jgi:hypothetical protein
MITVELGEWGDCISSQILLVKTCFDGGKTFSVTVDMLIASEAVHERGPSFSVSTDC